MVCFSLKNIWHQIFSYFQLAQGRSTFMNRNYATNKSDFLGQAFYSEFNQTFLKNLFPPMRLISTWGNSLSWLVTWNKLKSSNQRIRVFFQFCSCWLWTLFCRRDHLETVLLILCELINLYPPLEITRKS